ncbi:MAG: hypothetical protein QNL88_01670 [Acidobacteriota bacterium]|nr:hypothetical protein [Acidobacteriota bacterium]
MNIASSTGGRPRLKVCCIASIDEARLAIRLGANAVGLVSAMPSGPGVIADERIEEIAATIPPCVSTFLLTSSRDVDEIIHQQHRFGVDTLQLCDEVAPGAIRDLRSKMPGISIVQVVHVADAVRQVRPFGVDVCSGLRTDGALDAIKLKRFIRRLGSVNPPSGD